MEYRPVNEKIRDPKLLVIDEDGSKIGQMNRLDAINYAKNKDLDLVLFVPTNKAGGLPIAKILDYGKFTYNEKVKARQSKKKQTVIKVKEIKIRPQTGIHDLEWRAKNVIEWLEDGCQVKFKIRAAGRVGFKQELIDETYNKFINLLQNKGKVIQPLKKITPIMYECTIAKNK